MTGMTTLETFLDVFLYILFKELDGLPMTFLKKLSSQPSFTSHVGSNPTDTISRAFWSNTIACKAVLSSQHLLLNADKKQKYWGNYLYSSCLCSQEMCPPYLVERHELSSLVPRTAAVRRSHGHHDLAFRHRENNEGQQLWIAGTITLLQTALELSKARKRLPKMSSRNLQGRQLLFSQIRVILDLPQWLTVSSVSCSEKRKQHLLFAWPWKAEEVEDFIYSTLRHGNLQTIVTSQRAFVFIFLLSLCGFCLPYRFFTDSLLPAPGTSVTCLHMVVSWREVLCSCMQIIMLLDGRNRSSFDQKALPLDLFSTFLMNVYYFIALLKSVTSV